MHGDRRILLLSSSNFEGRETADFPDPSIFPPISKDQRYLELADSHSLNWLGCKKEHS